MFKVVVYLKKKSGISRQQFIDHYENVHQVLGQKLLPTMIEYRRMYPVYGHKANFEGHFSDGPQAHANNEPEFDVITEITFRDENGFEEMLAAVRDPAIGQQIADDELNFIDPQKSRLLVVEEYVSDMRSR